MPERPFQCDLCLRIINLSPKMKKMIAADPDAVLRCEDCAQFTESVSPAMTRRVS